MVLLTKNYHYIEFSEPNFFFCFFWLARVPGGRHRAWGAGPDREISKNTENYFFWPARDLARNTEFPFYISSYNVVLDIASYLAIRV